MRVVASLSWAVVAFAGTGFAQPAFDVASIKLNALPLEQLHSQPIRCSNGRFLSTGMYLGVAIEWAYNIQYYQFAAADKFASELNSIYDIEAKSAPPITEDQCRVMVQKLFADRFKMAVHHERRTVQMYALVLGEGAPKLKLVRDSDPDSPGLDITVDGDRVPLRAKGWTMPDLARYLGRPFQPLPVIDRTGLQGRYRLSLSLSSRDPGGDVATAVQRDLNLKLEPRKEPMDVVVIDHLEKPDPN